MFVKYICLMPEALLLLNVVVMQIVHVFRTTQTPKTFSTISRFFIGAALAACIVFYNMGLESAWHVNSPYTTFFKALMMFSALICGFLACKWFLNQNQAGLSYYRSLSLTLFCLCIAVSTRHLGILWLFLILNVLFAAPLIKLNYDETANKCAVLEYYGHNTAFIFLLTAGIAFLSFGAKSFAYADVYKFSQTVSNIWFINLGVGLLIGALCYMLNAAPFHFCGQQIVKKAQLPTIMYFSLVPIWAAVALLLILCHNVFAGQDEYICMLLLCSGITSIILGVIGADSRHNIRQVFAGVGMFNIGVMLLMFSHFNLSGLQSGIMYLLVYMVSNVGIMTCFYGMRSHGEYLWRLEDLAGLALVKPYISASLLIFMLSLLGLPPLLGMLGCLTLVNNLLSQNSYGLIFFIFLMLAWLSHGMLGVIKSIYFDKRAHTFDRADKGVYLCLLLDILLLLTVVIKPRYLMSDIGEMTQLFLGQV